MYIKKHDKKSTLALFAKSTTMEVIPSDISDFTLKNQLTFAKRLVNSEELYILW